MPGQCIVYTPVLTLSQAPYVLNADNMPMHKITRQSYKETLHAEWIINSLKIPSRHRQTQAVCGRPRQQESPELSYQLFKVPQKALSLQHTHTGCYCLHAPVLGVVSLSERQGQAWFQAALTMHWQRVSYMSRIILQWMRSNSKTME